MNSNYDSFPQQQIVTNPQAGVPFCITPPAPTDGYYRVDVIWSTGGTTTGTDTDNIALVYILNSLVTGLGTISGTQGTPAISAVAQTQYVTLPTGATLAVQAIVNGGIAALYHVRIIPTLQAGYEV